MSDNQTPEERADTEEAAAAFGKDETEATPTDEAGVRQAITRGDRREYDAADRRRRRSKPTSSTNIPGVTIDDRGRARTHHPPKGTAGWRKKGEIHPRKKGTVRPGDTLGQAWSDLQIIDYFYDMLGPRRLRVLKKSLTRRGAPTAEEHLARVYLGQLLANWSETSANRAAALLIFGETRPGKERTRQLRKLGDLRRRAVSPEERAWFEREMADATARVAEQREREREQALAQHHRFSRDSRR